MATLLTPAAAAIPTTVASSAADATGNYILGNQDVVVRINNGSGGSITVTLDDPNTPAPEGVTPGGTYPDVVTTVAAGTGRYYVFNTARRTRFTDPNTGRINFTYSAVTSVTVEVVAVY